MQVRTLGIILLVVGIIMLTYTGFNYVTTEKVVDLGPINISHDKNHFVQWSPLVGVVLLVGGIAIIALKRNS